MPFFLFGAIVSIATGVCLAAATNVILPGVFTTWWTIAAGAGIGAIAICRCTCRENCWKYVCRECC
jgi:hypothetical protein